MKHRRLVWVFGFVALTVFSLVGCGPGTQSIVVDPPRSWTRVEWDRFIERLPGNPGQVEIDADTSSATSGEFDVVLFSDRRIALPGGVQYIYASRTDVDGSLSHSVKFFWGSQSGADAQRLLRELISQFNLVDGKSNIGPSWFSKLRVSERCEYSVLATLDGDGGVISFVRLSFSTTNGPETPVCG